MAGLDIVLPVRSSSVARNPIVVARLPDGGLISYRKPDGMYLHTLATPEAFLRKLRQLGFEPDAE